MSVEGLEGELELVDLGELAIAVLEVFPKSTRSTPDDVIKNCKRRLTDFRATEKR